MNSSRTHLPCALLLFALLGMPLRAQSGGPVSGSADPPDSTARRIADLESRLAELEQQTHALHQEISALKASVDPSDSHPEHAALVLAASVRTLRSDEASSAFPAAADPIGPSAVPSGANAFASGDLSSWNLVTGVVPIGLLDVYYSYNEHQPVSGVSTLRLFDDQTNQLALGLLELGFTKQAVPQSRFGYRLTAGFGDAINAVNSSDPGGLGFAQYLHEGYASYLIPAGNGLRTDVGKFDTAIGAESMESAANWNYSRSLLYNDAIPFYGFGVRSQYDFTQKYALTGYLVNGWNNLVDTYSSGKTKGLEFGWQPTAQFSITEAWLTGRGATDDTQEKSVSDTVARYAATPKLSFMADAVYGRSEPENAHQTSFFWTGAAGYAQYRFTPRWAAAARLEYYDDPSGWTTCGACKTPTPQNLKEATLTGERTVERHLLGRFEYRYDTSSQPVFYRAATPIREQMTLTLGLVYTLQPVDEPR